MEHAQHETGSELGPHGQRRTYQRGCRCLPCAAAHSDYLRHWRALRRVGQLPLGARVPAHRTHVLMKVLRAEQFSLAAVERACGFGVGNYRRVQRERRVTLRTVLRVQRFYRERVL